MGRIRKRKHGPEWYIQQDLIKFLETRGWLVEVMHGNLYQKGIPDLFAFRKDVGVRWIDCKNPASYTFTQDQRKKWPKWRDAGIGIWILTAATQEEYDKLFGPPNMGDYWKSSWGTLPTLDLDKLLDEIEDQ